MDAYKSDNVYCANDAGSPASTVTCGNNGNKATLMCVDGTFYTVENNKPKDINTVYLKSSCTLHEYKCDTNTYNLRASDITS
jgi:hypothetical protein